MFARSDWDRLLSAARLGDECALGQLLSVASEDLRSAASGVLRHATRGRLPVEDVFADAMLAVLREIGSLRATNYLGFRFWFTSIARNHVRRALRQERTRPSLTTGEEPLSPGREPRELSAESEAFLRGCLLRLPRNQQVAFILREGLALTWCTIGFVLERRASPAARLIHYRAALHVKDLAATRPELRCLAPAGVTASA